MKVKIYINDIFLQSCKYEHLDSLINELEFEFDFGDGMLCQWEPDENGNIYLVTV